MCIKLSLQACVTFDWTALFCDRHCPLGASLPVLLRVPTWILPLALVGAEHDETHQDPLL